VAALDRNTQELKGEVFESERLTFPVFPWIEFPVVSFESKAGQMAGGFKVG